MTGPLSAIFAAVNPIITANLAGNGIAPTFGTTSIDNDNEAAPPRILWLPTTENIDPARGLGGDSDAQGNLPSQATQPLYTRLCNVRCDIWGPDRDTVDLLMINAVVSAVHEALSGGSYGIQSAEWLLPEAIQKNGEVYRIVFVFMAPIIRVTPSTTTTTIPQFPLSVGTPFRVGS